MIYGIAQTVRSSRSQEKNGWTIRRKLLKGYGGDDSGLSASLALYSIVSFVLRLPGLITISHFWY
jgi:hypothetical protein